MKKEDSFPEIYFASRSEFRDWLSENHDQCEGIWVVYYKKTSSEPSLRYKEAVLESLCFGWIDSKAQTIDTERYRQIFTPRKAKSVWSRVNKNHIKNLQAKGLMAEPGLRSIEIAKANGSWTKLDAIEDFILPPELEAALAAAPDIAEKYDALSKSTRKFILYQIYDAKRPETKAKRLEKILGQIDRGESVV